jgi:hypothetical protein
MGNEKKITLGDKALYWGTIFGFLTAGAGGVAWLTKLDYTTTTTAQAQEKFHDSVDARLNQIDARLSHMEGQMDEIKQAVKQ